MTVYIHAGACTSPTEVPELQLRLRAELVKALGGRRTSEVGVATFEAVVARHVLADVGLETESGLLEVLDGHPFTARLVLASAGAESDPVIVLPGTSKG